MNRIQALSLAALLLLTVPAFAEPTRPATRPTTTESTKTSNDGWGTPGDGSSVQSNTNNPKRQELQQTEVDFLDSKEAYWVHKGFNDTIFGVNSGSFNNVRHEREQAREDEMIKKLYKPTQVVEIVVKGKTIDPATPLKIQGRKIEAPR